MKDILEAKIEFLEGAVNSIIVLVKISENDFRAIYSDRIPRTGYMNIPMTAKLNEDLLRKVAGEGIEVEIEKHFPSFSVDKEIIEKKVIEKETFEVVETFKLKEITTICQKYMAMGKWDYVEVTGDGDIVLWKNF